MKRVYPQEDWPEAWKGANEYDREEIYGEVVHRGYAGTYQLRLQETLRLCAEALPEGASILDIGAAQGNFSLSLAEMGFRVTWNDLRPELAGYVALKHERGEIAYAPGNAFELNFPELFDGVLIAEIIEHVAHPDQFLQAVAKLVKPGGPIVMTTPNGAYFRNNLPKFSECADPSVYESVQFKPNADGHIFLLHPEEIRELGTKAGLVLETMTLFANPLTAGHVKTEPILHVLPDAVVFGLEKMTQRLPFALRRRVSTGIVALFRRPG